MSDTNDSNGRDWRETLLLPKTSFPMRAGLPKREPEWLERWEKLELYKRLREDGRGREKYVLHDGPPYANGHIHLGTALNKILKDIIVRSMQMMGKDADYVPGWDCHGLPIEWKIEEKYRAKGKDKDEVEINEFRHECREFARGWIDVQREEFKRLGVIGDWDNPYTTMAYEAEAQIAREFQKFLMNGSLYRGSKPVMWSVVEQTALAEAEVEYHDYESETIWVKFPVKYISGGAMAWGGVKDTETDEGMSRVFPGDSIIIWTTTPWTIPGNRAISFSSKIVYSRYKIVEAENDFGPQAGEVIILADSLADECANQAKLTLEKLYELIPPVISNVRCEHPFKGLGGGYKFEIPLLEGDHVTDETGTGFVHTAPGHGMDDFEIWTAKKDYIEKKDISAAIPFTVDKAGFFTKDAPGFGPDAPEGAARVIDDKGKRGDANRRVIAELISRNALFARGRIKHQYPHSWRSKAPVIFINTPQWFIAMDKDLDGPVDTLRARALKAIEDTRFVPPAGQRRLGAMIKNRPDWVISRQRAWGVPLTVFVHKETGELLRDAAVNERIALAFEEHGADAWFEEGAKERFLAGHVDNIADWEQVRDILDVWFDSGSTHAFVLEEEHNKGKWDLKWPADLYLEGSDQHRGWFHSSLLESCGTRGRAPYDAVLTHGFIMAEDGRKMSKSLGNQVFPQDITRQSGAEILRLWVSTSDYWEDMRIGPEIIKTNTDAYRKLRNTLRFLLGNLHGFEENERVDVADMPELERVILHRLVELDEIVRRGYHDFDFKKVFSALFHFATIDLSAFYFDIRKDALYCDAPSSIVRRSCRTVLDEVFSCLTAWAAPMLCFTMEEVWLTRFPSDEGSVHLRQFPQLPQGWRDDTLAEKWHKVRALRKVVTGALEIERREKRIGSSLEAAPVVYVTDAAIFAAMDGVDLAEISITSQARLVKGDAPEGAFALDDVAGVAVVPEKAKGRKCQRSWKILPDVGSDPEFPELSPRDAAAVREWDAANG